MNVRSDVQEIRYTATLRDTKASLSIDGKPAVSGQQSQPIKVKPGRNAVLIEVTAEDGKTKRVYDVKIPAPFPTPNWTRVVEAGPFAPRDSAGELVFKNRMWILGGYLPELVSDVWSSADGKQWERVGEVPDKSGINTPVAFAHAGRMWVCSQDGKFYSSENGADWKLVTEKAPWSGRYCAGSAVFAGRMWVLGGLKDETLYNDAWSSVDGVEWKLEIAHAPWSPRQLFGNVVVHNNQLHVVGGGVTIYQPFKAYRDVWRSPDGKTWEKVTDLAPWPARIWSSCTVYRGRIWLLGGFRAHPEWNNFNDIWYSADGADWRQLISEDVWAPRHEANAYVHDDKLWLIAGNVWPLVNDVWQLNLPGLAFTSQPVVEEFVHAQYSYYAQADFNRYAGPVSYRLAQGPSWLSVDTKSGLVRGTPPELGEFAVVVEAAAPGGAAGETARQAFTLHVIPARFS